MSVLLGLWLYVQLVMSVRAVVSTGRKGALLRFLWAVPPFTLWYAWRFFHRVWFVLWFLLGVAYLLVRGRIV